ncbi:M12 family metallo-peptidase [Apibacter raozihei]|uniref:M12 family metallo-peptidase n=1 Tax=Apibacter raozihei TaxID=2500547 RepID=UPI000FE2AE47|nr:M12 family metallo-peptidase [Apibacter raozihei]
MKTIIRLLFSLNILFLFSQEVIISNKIKELHSENKEFIKYSLFSESITSQKKSKFKTVSPDATILSLREFRLEQLVKEQPEQLEIEFPYNGNMITVELYKTEILTPDFSANTHNGEKINYTPGTHYRGIIKGNKTSVVSFSFYKNEVIGVSSSNELGNIELGKIKNSNDYISYSDHHLKGENPFSCAADELEENKEYLAKNKSKFNNLKTDLTNNCVRVYYEIAYKPYELNDSNIEATLNWITSIHNNIATLYANDGINITLSDILIWTEPDPYTGNHTYNLQKFRSIRPAFKGDLGNLINSPLSTSTAYMNSLCFTHNYAYSGVDLFYENVPAYSWTILAMAHEMGHSLGSPHTHACAWNGNNTAIDGCGPKYSEEYKEGDCPRGPIPTNKGTIMSYCHLLANIGVGIDLNNGFGPQPAELIRNTVESKSCLGSDCTNEFYCKKTIDDIFINNIKKHQQLLI